MSENQFAMVSDWMANGNINNFVKAHPDVNRLGLVGFYSMFRFEFIDDWVALSWEASLGG